MAVFYHGYVIVIYTLLGTRPSGAEIDIQNLPGKRPALIRLRFARGDAARLHTKRALVAATVADLRTLLEAPSAEEEMTVDMGSAPTTDAD